MKKILLILFFTISFTCRAIAWNEVQEGAFIDNLKQNGDEISYSIKVNKNSNLWKVYIQDEASDDIEYLQGDFVIDCASKKVKGNVSTFDANGKLIDSAKTSNITNENISQVCSVFKTEDTSVLNK